MKLHFHVGMNVIGGAETQLRSLVRHLARDHEILVTYQYAELEYFIESMMVDSVWCRSQPDISQMIEGFKPDIFQFYHCTDAFRAAKKAKHPIKVVEVIHNRFSFPGDASCYPKSYTHACVCVSDDAQNWLLAKAPNARTVVIPNGVDTNEFYPALTVVNKAPKKRRLGGYAGRLESGDHKGIESLVKLVEKLPVEFELIGRDYSDWTQRLKDHPKISVIGHVENVADRMRTWDFFVSRSPAEGFGLSIAEALACGLPSVIFDCGGVTRFIKNGHHAFVCQNDFDMQLSLKKVLNGAELHPSELDLSSEKMAKAYEDLYYRLTGAFRKSKASYHEAIYNGPTKTLVVSESRSENKSSTDPVVIQPRLERLGVVEPSWYGVRRALLNCCDAVVSPAEAAALIRSNRPKRVVFGCYMPQWQPILRAARDTGSRSIITWHASFILNEFDHANRVWMAAAIQAVKTGMATRLATPHQGLASTFRKLGVKTDYLPNIVKDELKPRKKLPGINIGILGSGQPWKNMECQIIAASMIPKAKIWIQNLKHPEVVNVLGIPYTQVPYIDSDDEYYDLVGGMTVNMVASLSEVYSYFTVESLMLGTPILTTPITPVLRFDSRLSASCTTPHFEDPMELAAKLKRIIEDREDLALIGRGAMLELNDANRKIVESVIESW